MTPHDFVAKWRHATLSERAAAQSHFIDLCRPCLARLELLTPRSTRR